MPSSVHAYSGGRKYTGLSEIFPAAPPRANGRVAARILPAIEPGIHARRREFGHSGAVNPEGCQTVAGGRRGVFGAATSGKRRRKGPAPRLGCQIGFCCACSRLAWPQSQLLAGRTVGVVLSAGPFCRYVVDLAPLSGVLDPPTPLRWSFPLCPERPPATLCQPCGLASTTEFCGKYPNSRAGHPCPAEGALALPHGVELRVYVRTARCHPLTQASGQPSGCCFPRTARQSRAEASASANLLRLPIKPA